MGSYSLRASPLLLMEPNFHRLITRYFLVLLALGIFVMTTREAPTWMPTISGALGLLLLIISVAELFIFLIRILQIVSSIEIILLVMPLVENTPPPDFLTKIYNDWVSS